MSSSRSGLAKPRSAKMLPLPFLTRILAFRFILVVPFSVILFRSRKPLFYQVDFLFRRRYAPLCLLLKSMKNVDCLLEAHGVSSTVCVARVGRYDFENGPATETLQSLYARGFFTPWGGIKSLPNSTPHGGWESPEISSGRSYPPNRLQLTFRLYHYTFICMFCLQVSMSHAIFSGTRGPRLLALFLPSPSDKVST